MPIGNGFVVGASSESLLLDVRLGPALVLAPRQYLLLVPPHETTLTTNATSLVS